MIPLRVGIVGLGRIFDLNYLGYRENPAVDVVGLCDSRQELLDRRAPLFPKAQLVQDLAELLRLDLDLVDVLTPHPLHAEMAVAAMRAGAHVSVQKPMAMTVAEADRMIATATETGRQLKCFENFVFYPPLVRAKALLDEGAIGRPLHFRMKVVSGDRQRGWPVPAETAAWRQALGRSGQGGPLVFDHGHHMLAVACWLFGDVRDAFARIEETDASQRDRRRRTGLADVAPSGPPRPRDLGHHHRAEDAHPDRLLRGTRAVRDPG